MELQIAHLWDGTPALASERVTLRLSGSADSLLLDVDAPFHGDPAPDAAPGALMGLWEYEVVELFVLGDDNRYTEIEIGPHGHHLVLRLHGRRQMTEARLALDYSAHIAGQRWHGQAKLDRALLPPGAHRINAYAIHGSGSARRYLAWQPVPGAEPDYHRLEFFESVVLP